MAADAAQTVPAQPNTCVFFSVLSFRHYQFLCDAFPRRLASLTAALGFDASCALLLVVLHSSTGMI